MPSFFHSAQDLVKKFFSGERFNLTLEFGSQHFFCGHSRLFLYQNMPINYFAIGLTFFIALLGWAAKEFTIWHAIAGHFSYDLVLLMYHRRTAGHS
ncbi:MAG: hypothetical protein IPG07_06820 [Crocinitomicaceae bacterium]|nr:hypothetical protein [Crocinitomicaceae bacterium]